MPWLCGVAVCQLPAGNTRKVWLGAQVAATKQVERMYQSFLQRCMLAMIAQGPSGPQCLCAAMERLGRSYLARVHGPEGGVLRIPCPAKRAARDLHFSGKKLDWGCGVGYTSRFIIPCRMGLCVCGRAGLWFLACFSAFLGSAVSRRGRLKPPAGATRIRRQCRISVTAMTGNYPVV